MSESKHASAIVKIEEPADGLVAVTVRCCGDPTSDSVVTLHELHRPDSEIDLDIAQHRARVEKLHAARQHVKRHLARIGVSDADCGCP